MRSKRKPDGGELILVEESQQFNAGTDCEFDKFGPFQAKLKLKAPAFAKKRGRRRADRSFRLGVVFRFAEISQRLTKSAMGRVQRRGGPKTQGSEGRMSLKLVVGLDGHSTGEKALAHAQKMAETSEGCEMIAVYVIEWSPFTFQTAEENAQRHKRREEEISTALERIVDPAVAKMTEAGLTVKGMVRHGNVADVLDGIAREQGADQIIVGRSSDNGLTRRIFGSATGNLVMNASVPVTVVV